MKNVSKALIWFIISFIVFHAILFVMWGEHQEYWYLYTGIMLIAGISYVFIKETLHLNDYFNWNWYNHKYCTYNRTTHFSLISSELSYASLIKRIIKNRRLFQMANAHYVNIRNSVS